MASDIQERLVFRAAWLYYMQDKLQSEVATELGVSRASVALYLKQARESGMVRIGMDEDVFKEHKSSLALEARFDLDSAYVLSCQGNHAELLPQLGTLGGEVLLKHLVDGDELGVAWGQQLYELAANLQRKKLIDLEVVQLCGNLGAPFEYAPEQCTLEIASKLHARSRNLYAPLALSTPAIAQALRKESIIADQLRIMKTCTKAVFSIGSCDENSHVVQCGALKRSELEKVRKQGARAVIAGRLVDKNGKQMQDEKKDRTIGISLSALKKVPFRLVVAGGNNKAQAIHAALSGGYATHLVIDQTTAEKVLALDN